MQREARVRAALAALPARQRAALVLCYYEERSQAEAAALLGRERRRAGIAAVARPRRR